MTIQLAFLANLVVGGADHCSCHFTLPVTCISITYTLFSRRSSKSRRKADRKKHSLREGSAHEDLALVEALSETVVTVDRLQDEIFDLLSMLVFFGLMDEGRTLQTGFERLVGVVKSRMKEVWSIDGEQALEAKETVVQVFCCCSCTYLELYLSELKGEGLQGLLNYRN